MPRASRKPIRKNLNQELNVYFASLISSLNKGEEIEQFFKDFLTTEEKIMLTKRLMLHLMLENGYKTSQIEAVLGMSRETIRVHGYIWSGGGAIYKRIISKIAGKEKTKRFWDKVDKVLKPLDLALRSRTDMQARVQLGTGVSFDD